MGVIQGSKINCVWGERKKMNIVVQIVNFVLPYLVNFVSKHMEGWLNCFSKYISQKILDKTDVSIALKCIDKNNNKIDTPIAVFNSTKYGEIAKIGNSEGIIKLQGIIDSTKIKIIKDGYEDKTIELSIPSTNSYIEKIVIM